MPKAAAAGMALVLAPAPAAPGGRGGQDEVPVGFLSRDRIIEMAAVDVELAEFIFRTRFQIAQDMVPGREFFRSTYHKGPLPPDRRPRHGPR